MNQEALDECEQSVPKHIRTDAERYADYQEGYCNGRDSQYLKIQKIYELLEEINYKLDRK